MHGALSHLDCDIADGGGLNCLHVVLLCISFFLLPCCDTVGMSWAKENVSIGL
jgi:hypothetical protein